ncbi:cyclophilin peptidyl-prolyl cis-trans isomerase Cyp8 [Coemansia guatemalensis]|uniref:Cyclophilin peptidyl-prolyl cis-trans isomerase Cyp8 n=1 Tax=Coemansia guatemalensis TaxID=2761395 RepID=A0A9W8LVI3_9FUNG|nr:cyclophilin peptidyl-prolyl cis-trans isomerase Cyp8 [Coemansia guatemalensis]
MGRWTDKPFISQGEWSNAHDDSKGLPFGGKKTQIQGKRDTAGALAFDCCALSLKPFKSPMCTPDGYVFDSNNIIEYVKENHKHPFTGEHLDTKGLLQIKYHKNADGNYVDPVTFKQFSEFTKIVVNRKTGHVYLASTIDEFNAKPDSWNDLVTGDPFTRDDIIILQDPNSPKTSNGAAKGKVKTPSGSAEKRDTVTKPSAAATAPMKRQPYNAATYSKGIAAASFTSTAMAPVTKNDAELIDAEEYMFARIKGKGYVRLCTNMGDINLELYCDKAPRTCYNFIKLAQAGYYKGTKFHRSIKNFMLQGGDPTASGRGGKSHWGSEFKDEISKRLSHSERGVLSMANRGPNTNTSQFFILYRTAKHLDGKHTIFGRVVGGLPVLSKIEAVPTDDDDRPKSDIVISDVFVFVDPYAEFTKRLERKLEHEKDNEDLALGKRRRRAEEEEEHERETTTWFGTKLAADENDHIGTTAPADKKSTGGVGKYLKKPVFKQPAPAAADGSSQRSKKAAVGYKFGSFNNW